MEAFTSTGGHRIVWASWRLRVPWAHKSAKWKEAGRALQQLLHIHFFGPMNDSPVTVYNSSQRAWDLSLSYCHLCCLKQMHIPLPTLWLRGKLALTNACGLVCFMYQLFFQMIGSTMVTGVVGFTAPLQQKIKK